MTDIPFVWPSTGTPASHDHQGVQAPVWNSVFADAVRMFGIVSGLDRSGVEWLSARIDSKPEMRCFLVVTLFPACRTERRDLEDLLELQVQNASSVQFRLMLADRSVASPGTTVCAANEQHAVLATGTAPNLWQGASDPALVSLFLHPDDLLLARWRAWFDEQWDGCIPLTPDTALIPALVPAPGDARAGALWRSYTDRCMHVQAAGVPGVQEEPGAEATDALAAPVEHAETETQSSAATPAVASTPTPPKPATEALGFPPHDPLRDRIFDLVRRGKSVTIAPGSRVGPLDAPINPKWFGTRSSRRVGSITRRVSYRISAIDEEDLKALDNERKGTQELLESFSFSLGEGQRWIPDTAWPLFQQTLDGRDVEARTLFNRVVANDVDAFLKAKQEKVLEDARAIFRETNVSQDLPPDIAEKILASLSNRLKQASSGQFLPRVTRGDFRPALDDQSRWSSAWGQVSSLLTSIAEYPRKLLTDPYFARGAVVSPELEKAMDVWGDHIVRLDYRAARDMATAELALMEEAKERRVTPDSASRCYAALMDGLGVDRARALLAEPPS